VDLVKKLHCGLLNMFGAISGLLIAGIAVGVTLDVLLRNVGISCFSWVIEVAEYSLYIATFFAAPWVLRNSGHIKVDLLTNCLPQPFAKILDVVADLAGLVICAVLFWSGYTVTAEAAHVGSMIMKELVVVEWYLLLLVPVSFFLMAVEFYLRILHTTLSAGSIKIRQEPAREN